jgi:hypothetical protein
MISRRRTTSPSESRSVFVSRSTFAFAQIVRAELRPIP